MGNALELLERLMRQIRSFLAAAAEAFARFIDPRPRLEGATDRVLVESLQWIANQEQAHGPLWSEPENEREFRVADTPVYFIHRSENGTPLRAYLLNFPDPPASAIEIDHSLTGLGPMLRYDEQMGELSEGNLFTQSLVIAGRRTFAMAYTPADMNGTPSPRYSRLDGWMGTFVHELFHHYQHYGPDSHWRLIAWGGLDDDYYPVTADNIALALLERAALQAGREATTTAERVEVLRRVLAIRQARTRLPEVVRNKCQISTPQPATVQEQAVTSPDGIGQSFTACQTGFVRSLKVNVLSTASPNATLQFRTGTDASSESYSQEVDITAGENMLWLNAPLPVDEGAVYSFVLLPSAGILGLMAGTVDAYPRGEVFRAGGSGTVIVTPSTDLVFELTIEEANYVDQKDRYQERLEGSARHVERLMFVRSENTAYAEELLEKLMRQNWTHYQASRDELERTVFDGGWYETGSAIIDLLDEVTTADGDWRSTFPDGGSPIGVLERLYGPASHLDVEQLVEDAKQAYDWPAIAAQVAAIPSDNLDPPQGGGL